MFNTLWRFSFGTLLTKLQSLWNNGKAGGIDINKKEDWTKYRSLGDPSYFTYPLIYSTLIFLISLSNFHFFLVSSNVSGVIKSPRNIFLYGRGGATNLSCVYRLEAGAGQKVRLTVHNASFGETDCTADRDIHTGRQLCVRQPGSRITELQVADVPWRDTKVI